MGIPEFTWTPQYFYWVPDLSLDGIQWHVKIASVWNGSSCPESPALWWSFLWQDVQIYTFVKAALLGGFRRYHFHLVIFKAVELYILWDICGGYVTNISKSLLVMFFPMNFHTCFTINNDPNVNVSLFLFSYFSCIPVVLFPAQDAACYI